MESKSRASVCGLTSELGEVVKKVSSRKDLEDLDEARDGGTRGFEGAVKYGVRSQDYGGNSMVCRPYAVLFAGLLSVSSTDGGDEGISGPRKVRGGICYQPNA